MNTNEENPYTQRTTFVAHDQSLRNLEISTTSATVHGIAHNKSATLMQSKSTNQNHQRRARTKSKCFQAHASCPVCTGRTFSSENERKWLPAVPLAVAGKRPSKSRDNIGRDNPLLLLPINPSPLSPELSKVMP
jgi:phosphoribosylanthranilate isomerase